MHKTLVTHLAERSHEESLHHNKSSYFTISVLVTVIILLCVVTSVYFAYKYFKQKKRPLCTTAACNLYRDMLQGSINFDLKPCDDFYQYTCDKWNTNYQVPTYRHHLAIFFKTLFKTLRGQVPSEHQTAVEKAVRFFQSCKMAAYAKGRFEGGYQDLVDIWKKCDILWPRVNRNGDILRTMICIYDSFFMDTVLGIVKQHDTQLPYLFPGKALKFLHDYSESIKNASRYQEYYEGFRDLMKTADIKDGEVQTYEAFSSIEDVVYSNLVKPQFMQYNRTRIALWQLTGLTDGIGRTRWQEVFKTEFGLQSSSMSVDVSSIEYIREFNRVLKSVGEVELQRYVGWVSVQQMAPYINSQFSAVYHGVSELADVGLQVCLHRTEVYLGWSVFSKYATRYLDSATRKDIHGIINAIYKIVHSMVTWSEWIEQKRPQTAYEIMRRLAGLLVYADRFENPKHMDPILSSIGDMGDHVFHNWQNASKGLVRIDAPRLQSIISAFQQQMVPEPHYTFWNTQQQTFLMPPYVPIVPLYLNVSNAVKYGALGFLISDVATKLLHMYYPSAKRRNWPCLNDSRDGGEDDTQIVHSAFALYFAWEAFKGVAVPDSDDLLPELSDAQLFFVAYCLLMCGEPRDEKRFVRRCNEPLRHHSAFSKAFSCPANSPMNAKEKCAFF
ncbi:endothelin-converting enzyme 2-like isoform X2 [Ornithodoros turicata]